MDATENQDFGEMPAMQIGRSPEEEDTIDLVELFYTLWGQAWKIFLCLVLGAAVSFGWTHFCVTPLYTADSSIYIVSASNKSVVDLTDLQIGAQLTADYRELMYSRPLLEDVIKNLDLVLTVSELSEMLQITNTPDTRILKIAVTSPDPNQAADIANELVKQACIYLPQIMETEEPNLVEQAIPPMVKSSPSYAKNIILGGLLGAVLCSAVLVGRYLLDDTFKTPDDISRYFGVQPLATIPEADVQDGRRKRAGRAWRKKAQ